MDLVSAVSNMVLEHRKLSIFTTSQVVSFQYLVIDTTDSH